VLKLVDGLVAELRSTGVPVSVSEHLDAALALEHIDLLSRAEVRSALLSTLVKNAAHLGVFDLVFDLYFGWSSEPGSVSDLTEANLRATLVEALGAADNTVVRLLAAELVNRHVRIDPGRPVAGTFHLYRVMRAVDVDRLRLEVSALRPIPDGPAATLYRRLAAEQVDGALDLLRQEVESEIRRRLVEDRGADAVARTVRQTLPEDLDFLHASQRDTEVLRTVLQPLARKLAARLKTQRRRGTQGALDFRRTVRRSISSGAVADPVFRPRRPAKPRLVVVADISGSVASFAGFTLQLAYSLRTEFAAVRSFVFVDGVDEVTGLFEQADDLAAAVREINARESGVRRGGRSDYGSAFESFAARFGAGIGGRTTVLVLGDARTNNLPPRAEALKAVARRSAHLYWLNPEPAAAWDSGDSVMAAYAPYCERVVECRSVRQLRSFVESMGS
jgi:uncharacterized protein with von Willebrand factor type A (vWA) domain